MTWSPFAALPSYFGGKRKLCPRIFREIARYIPQRKWPECTLLDPFAGGCSVSLYAKAQGFRVICGDVADRSYITARALIVNNTTKLRDDDIAGLVASTDTEGILTDVYARRRRLLNWFVTDEVADLVRTMLANVERDADSENDRYWLRRYLIVRFIFLNAPYGQMSTSVGLKAAAGNEEGLTSSQVRRLVTRWQRPLPFLMGVAGPINEAIFGNGREHVAFQGDARDFLDRYTGDVLYLDPPYPGVLDYEEAYWPIDCLLAGHMIPRVRSRFSHRQGWRYLAEILEAAEDIPLWVISLGNAEVTLRELTHLIERYRPVSRSVIVKYAHLRNVASAQKTEENREYLVMAFSP